MRLIAIDTETHYDEDFGGMSVFIFGEPTNRPFCVTVSENDDDFFYTEDQYADKVVPLCEDESVTKIGANIKYDIHMLLNAGIEIKGPIHDVLVIHHLLNEEDLDADGKRIRGLKAIADKYIGEDSSGFEKRVDECRKLLAQESDRSKNEVSFREVYDHDPELMMQYAMKDTRITLELFNLLYPRLADQDLLGVYEAELQTLRALVQVERNGMRVDSEYLTELDEVMTAELVELEAKILAIADFNVNSSEELVTALEGLGVVYIDKTDSGAWDTAAQTLEKVANRSEVSDQARELLHLVLEYRQFSKLRETYVSNLIHLTQADGRVHPSFFQIGTVTGRMSCNNPNF